MGTVQTEKIILRKTNKYKPKVVQKVLRVFTFTLDGLKLSLCNDHVDLNTFKTAFKNSGRTGGVSDEQLSYEWWVADKYGNWVPSNSKDPMAYPVTVMEW